MLEASDLNAPLIFYIKYLDFTFVMRALRLPRRRKTLKL